MAQARWFNDVITNLTDFFTTLYRVWENPEEAHIPTPRLFFDALKAKIHDLEALGGSRIYIGSIAPNVNDHEIGDLYIDAVSGDFYTKKVDIDDNEYWDLEGNLKVEADAASWGTISGTLSAQGDLQSALNNKLTAAPIDTKLYAQQNGSWVEITLSGTPTWGNIIGTLSAQTDLVAALAAKANTSHTQTASTITDFNAAVAANAAVVANTAKVGVTDELKASDIDTFAKLNTIVADATLVETSDSRLSDARTPTAHTHTASQVTDFDAEVANNSAVAANTAKVGVTTELKSDDINTLSKLNAIVADATLIDTTDARLSDARTPTSHNHVAADITDFDTEVGNNSTVTGIIETYDASKVRIVNETTTTRELILTDAGAYIRCNNVSDITITVPPNAGVALPLDTVITFRQLGIGVITIVNGTGVTLLGDKKSSGQDKSLQIVQVSANVWDVIGGVA